MADGMGGLSETIERHPALIGLAVFVVAVLAYLNRGTPSAPAYTIGGSGRGQTDPGAVAVQEAAIQAGTQNVGTLAQLVGLEHSDDSSVTVAGYGRDVSLFQTTAARDVAQGQTAAGVTVAGYNRDVSLFNTTAQRDVSLAGINAAQSVAHEQTAANVTMNANDTAAQLEAARISAATQNAVTAANAATAKQAADNQNFAIQADKDKARAAANAGIADSFIHVVGDVVKFLTFGLF